MKKCSECNRTFSDDSLSFCLIDGSILSAPFDSEPTLVIPPTQAAQASTLEGKQSQSSESSAIKKSGSPRLSYAIILILAVLLTATAVALLYERGKRSSTASNAKAMETPVLASGVDKNSNSQDRSSIPATSEQTPRERTPSPDLNGEWYMVNTIGISSLPVYINTQVGFRLFLRQVGQAIQGDGEKTWLSTRPLKREEHTLIHLTGQVNGDRVEANFVEEGQRRKTSGRFVWNLQGDGRLIGTFVSTAADTSGESNLTRK